jgi:hypothetical protein
MATAKMAAVTASQPVTVRHGCRALAEAMARVNVCMVVPFWGRVPVGMPRNVGSDVVSPDHHTW